MYTTTGQLQAINGRYSPHGTFRSVTEADLAIVNALITRIEAARTGTPIPQAGDRVICQLADGLGTIHAERALIEKIEDDGRISICVRNASAQVFSDILPLSVSGGPYFYARPEELDYIGPVAGEFWAWGTYGSGGGSGIDFNATVNQWRIMDEERRFI